MGASVSVERNSDHGVKWLWTTTKESSLPIFQQLSKSLVYSSAAPRWCSRGEERLGLFAGGERGRHFGKWTISFGLDGSLFGIGWRPCSCNVSITCCI